MTNEKPTTMDEYPTTIRGKGQYKYCPLCGEETRQEEQPVGRFKTNLVVKCPQHGELIHD